MTTEKKIGVLQSLFVGITADAVLRLGNEGVLAKVTKDKKHAQPVTGKLNAALFGIENPEECFTKTREILSCANWKVEPKQNGFTAKATSCKLCAMAKKLGSHSPCNIYCLDIQEGMIKSFNADAVFTVKETLWDGQKCDVSVILSKENRPGT